MARRNGDQLSSHITPAKVENVEFLTSVGGMRVVDACAREDLNFKTYREYVRVTYGKTVSKDD